MFELVRTYRHQPRFTSDPFQRVWADFALPSLGWAAPTARGPAADVVETADQIVVAIDLPGFKPEEIQIKVEKDVLTVEAERKVDAGAGDKGETYHRNERGAGKLARAFSLPTNVDASRTVANYESGVLRIALPKREETKARTIPVNAK